MKFLFIDHKLDVCRGVQSQAIFYKGDNCKFAMANQTFLIDLEGKGFFENWNHILPILFAIFFFISIIICVVIAKRYRPTLRHMIYEDVSESYIALSAPTSAPTSATPKSGNRFFQHQKRLSGPLSLGSVPEVALQTAEEFTVELH